MARAAKGFAKAKAACLMVSSFSGCKNNKLTSIDGAPKVVGGDFICYGNTKIFNVDDVREVSKVDGIVMVHIP